MGSSVAISHSHEPEASVRIVAVMGGEYWGVSMDSPVLLAAGSGEGVAR